MRMNVGITAIDFLDLYILEKDLGKILDGVIHISPEDKEIKITLSCHEDKRHWYVRITSDNTNQEYSELSIPLGATMEYFLYLAAQKLYNYLLSSQQYYVEVDRMCRTVSMVLKRIG